MLRAILNKSWRQHLTKHQLYGHLTPITKTIKARRTIHVGRAHKWCTPMDASYGQAKAGWSARTYIQQLRQDKGCSPEDLPEAMNDREKWQERVRDILTSGTTWWWWWWWWRKLSTNFYFGGDLGKSFADCLTSIDWSWNAWCCRGSHVSLENVWTSLFPSYELNGNTNVILLQGLTWHWIRQKDWYAIKQRNQAKPRQRPRQNCMKDGHQISHFTDNDVIYMTSK